MELGAGRGIILYRLEVMISDKQIANCQEEIDAVTPCQFILKHVASSSAHQCDCLRSVSIQCQFYHNRQSRYPEVESNGVLFGPAMATPSIQCSHTMGLLIGQSRQCAGPQQGATSSGSGDSFH